MYLLYDNGYKNFQGGSWGGQQYPIFHQKFLGKFVLATDTVPPGIPSDPASTAMNCASVIRMYVRNQDFEACGRWGMIQMRYEHKQSVIWSNPPSGKSFREVILKRKGSGK